MDPRRADLLIACAGALVGAGSAALWGGASGHLAAAVLLGASLGGARRFPVATWAFASAVLVVTALQGALPGDDAFAVYPLVTAHALFAGRYGRRWSGIGGLVALTAAGVAAAALAHDAVVPFLFITPAGWGAGRALRDRELVAAQLAERARELEEERDAYATLSVRYERARVASELHDIVAHAISVMVVQASAGQRLAPYDPEATAATFEAIAGAAREAERDMGRLVALLGDEGAIAPAPDLALVEELVARAAASGLDVTLRLEGEREGLPTALGEIAYRVVQEGMTNALRYAAGAAVSVTVHGDAAILVVEVENAPADHEASLVGAGTGTGIAGLRERVGALGGALDAGPTAPAAGC